MKKRKIIGLPKKKVKLYSYNPKWQSLYKKEEKLLRSVIGKYVKDIQHIGSTSILEIKAKPIIDIVIGVESLKIGEKCIKTLEELGYEYKHDAGIRGRHFFEKGSKKNKTHYVHIEKINGRLWKNHILFRDYLINHKKDAKKYDRLKERLAKRYKDDRNTYTIKKESFIKKTLKKAETLK